MKLWDHQQLALSQIQESIDSGYRNICVASPTGGGKTLMASTRMMSSGKRSVFYTNRRMLFSQTSQRFHDIELSHGCRAAGYEPRYDEDIQIAMLQTEQAALKRGRSLHNAEEIIVDEAHNNAAGGCLEIFQRHEEMQPGCVRIGFTATPLGIGHAYDRLVMAGTNSELRKCGAHVPAKTYAPDEPDSKLVGKVVIGEGECGIPNAKRKHYATRVFGRVVDNYLKLNPEQLPAVLFAPGVAESVWFAESLTSHGIKSAHIDGENCWLDGEIVKTSDSVRREIEARTRDGEIKIVCNRFVLREGIDWPFIYHGIFATLFGSLTAYLQAGGRMLRYHPSMDHVIIQDHGGNWWRHGSLNADRQWRLDSNDRIEYGERVERIREKQEKEPIVCPKCSAVRLSGSKCVTCGYFYEGKQRPVLQANGTLKPMENKTLKPKRYLEKSEQIEREWCSRVRAIQKSKKDTVKTMTFSQLSATFARDHYWQYPPRSLPMMPVEMADFFRPIQSVPDDRLNR